MNKKLTKEIATHIFALVGFYNHTDITNRFIVKLCADSFKLDKKIAFESEEGKRIENNLWAMSAKVESSNINFLLADISEISPEFVLLIQMDNFPCQAVQLSFDGFDNENDGLISFNPGDNHWIDSDILSQAKLLAGLEQMSNLFIKWQKLTDFDDLYKKLIGLLNAGKY